MAIRTFLALITALALTSILSVSLAQGSGGPPPAPGGTIEVDDDLPADIIAGPLGVATNFAMTNGGPATVTLYVVNSGADPLPEDFEIGDDLPEGWAEGGTLDDGEGTTIGAPANGTIRGLSHGRGGSDVTYS